MCESREDRYINFIHNDCANKHVFLISSGSLSKGVIPRVHNLPQLYAVNIYCSDITSRIVKRGCLNFQKYVLSVIMMTCINYLNLLLMQHRPILIGAMHFLNDKSVIELKKSLK